jgi:uncharacterized membrane protein
LLSRPSKASKSDKRSKTSKKPHLTSKNYKSDHSGEEDEVDGPIKMEKENNDITNLIDIDPPRKHEDEKRNLTGYIKLEQMPTMKYYLDCGFNLLVYGVGSKRNILNYFASSLLANDHVLIINGFHSAANIKLILN